MNIIKYKRIFIISGLFVYLEIGLYFFFYRCYNNGVNIFIFLFISWKLWLFYKSLTCLGDGGLVVEYMSLGFCFSFMFYDDFSFLC